MLRALDLFSGIGGITYGLRGIVTPIAYVEKNEDARGFLQRKYPDVPVFDDVCTFDAIEWKGKVDIITAGWPCTGFSTAGKGTGFDHEASGLFSEVIRITKECEPSYLFLENSHVLSKRKNISVVVDAFDNLGYDCKWLTCRATCVGAPHQRHRWFCLVIKRSIVNTISIPYVDKFVWSSGEPARQIEINSKINRLYIGFLGNSVVPDQVRYAITCLCNMNVEEDTTREWKPNGYSVNGVISTFHIKHPTRSPENITLTPRGNEVSFAKKCKINDVITSPITRCFWATPTYYNRKNTKPNRTLTKRQSKSLETQVGPASGGKQDWHISSYWISWLMGYPEQYLHM
ncbi:cytosine-specific methyltransferase [Paramecium bursaria Chlorella virus NE-JV-4]|nr:cytosine-specific methyltransferase [Paramecium bursaria Chlorella virus NE-JV-4]